MTSREKLKELEDSQRNGFMGYNQRMNITNVLSAMWPINWFSIYNYYSEPPAPGKKCNNNWATYNGQRCINARIVELEKIIQERPNWKVFLKEALITSLIPLIIFYILGQNFHYIGKVLQNKNISNKMAGMDSTEEPYWPSDPAPIFNEWWHDCNIGNNAGSLTNSKSSASIVNMPKTDDWNKYGSPFFNNIKYQEFAEACTINNDKSKQNASYVWITHFLLADWWSSYRSFINNYIKITVPGPETNNIFNSICYYLSPLFALLPLIVLSLPWPFILTIKGLLTLIRGKLKIWPFTNLKPQKFAEQENDDPEQLGCFGRFAKMRDNGLLWMSFITIISCIGWDSIKWVLRMILAVVIGGICAFFIGALAVGVSMIQMIYYLCLILIGPFMGFGTNPKQPDTLFYPNTAFNQRFINSGWLNILKKHLLGLLGILSLMIALGPMRVYLGGGYSNGGMLAGLLLVIYNIFYNKESKPSE